MSDVTPTYLLGDIHGNFNKLLKTIKDKSIHSCRLISVGDLGIGFNYSYQGELDGIQKLNEIFAEREIDFMAIRGNHDDPAFWGIGDGSKAVNLSNFKLLPDYTALDIDDQKWLFVGGGISIDRSSRKLNLTYWHDEVFNLDITKIVKCDVLVTHSGPSWIGPFDKNGIAYWCDRDLDLWEECRKERKDHDMLTKLCQAKQLFLGHFHMFHQVEHGGCLGRILDIDEILEYRKPIV